MPPCLTRSYKVQIKGKWSNPGKRAEPSLTPGVVSIEKEPSRPLDSLTAYLLTFIEQKVLIIVDEDILI